MSIGNLAVGSYAPMTAGSSAVIKNSSGALLGFYASVAGTASIYDSATNTATTPIGTALVINVGWNTIPVTFINGCYIMLTTAAGTAIFV
jgi:hypothetical protein